MPNQPEVREQMFKLIEQWQGSGLTQNAFCQQHAIRYHVFHYWYRRYRQSKGESNNSSFVKLQVAKSSPAGSVEINYPGGIRIIFHEAISSNYLKALIS